MTEDYIRGIDEKLERFVREIGTLTTGIKLVEQSHDTLKKQIHGEDGVMHRLRCLEKATSDIQKYIFTAAVVLSLIWGAAQFYANVSNKLPSAPPPAVESSTNP